MKRLVLLLLLLPAVMGLNVDGDVYIQGEVARITGAANLTVHTPSNSYKFLDDHALAQFALDEAGLHTFDTGAQALSVDVLASVLLMQQVARDTRPVMAGRLNGGDILVRQDGFERVVLHDFSGSILRLDPDTPSYGMKETFAVDPTTPGFSSASITRIATAPTLRKCTAYDYETQTCSGVWKVIARLVVGEPYTILVSGADPIFGESDSESEPDACRFSDDAGAGDGDTNVDCLSEVQTLDDGTTADLQDPEQGGGPSEIYINFSNSLSIESISSVDVTFRYERLTNTEVADTSATIEVFDSGGWVTACTDTVLIGAFENVTCDLSTWVTTEAEANLVQTRIQFDTGKAQKGDSEGVVYVDNAYLSMDYVYLDLIAPDYFGLAAVPVSPKTYTTSNVGFEVNWTDDISVDTAWIEHNFTGAFQNITLSGGPQYIYSHNLSVGSYEWRMHANDTSSNENQTPPQTYTVNQASGSVELLLNGTNGNLEIDEDRSITINGTRLAGEVNMTLYENGTLISQGTEIDLNRNYDTPGLYTLTLNMSSSQNYTFAEQEWNLTVNDITAPDAVSGLANQSADESWIYWTWSNPSDPDFSHVIVEVNGSFFANVTTPYVNVTGLDSDTEYEAQLRTVDTSGNINESVVSDLGRTLVSFDFDPPLLENVTNTSILDSSAVISWDTDEIADTNVLYGMSSGTYTEQSYDGTDVFSHSRMLTGLDPATTYYYVVNSTDAAGNSNQSVEYSFTTLTDQTNPQYSSIEATPGSPSVYGTTVELNVTWSDNGALDAIWIEHNFSGSFVNESMSGGPEYTFQTAPGAGVYAWRSIANDSVGNENASMALQAYTITQASGDVQLTLNEVQDNISVNEDTIVNLTATRVLGEGVVELLEDDVILSTGSSPISNLKNYTQPGEYVITARLNATQNYTADEQNYTLTVNDTTPPSTVLGEPFNGKTSTDALVTFTFTPTDNVDTASCDLYIDDAYNQTNSSITNGATNSFYASFVDGDYNWTVECIDDAGNAQNSSTRDFSIAIIVNWIPTTATHNIDGAVTALVNESEGTISLLDQDEFVTTTAWSETAPANANITALDAHCEIDRAERGATLYFQYDTGTGFSADICGQPTNGVDDFSCDLFSEGVDTVTEMNNLDVRCVIRDSNGGSAANADLDFMYLDPEWTLIELPNFYPVASSFLISQSVEGQASTLSMNVTNDGIVGSSVTLRFLDDTRSEQIANVTKSLDPGETKQFNASWSAVIGPTNFTFAADPDDAVNELDETDNNASNSTDVNSSHLYYGNLEQRFFALGSGSSDLTFNWSQQDSVRIFASDADADIDLLSLQALTRTTGDALSFADLTTADADLGLSGFFDNLNSSYSTGGSLRATKTFTIAGVAIANVPIINSTSTQSFTTGILWDTSDDGDGVYDGSEDLVFVTEANFSQAGAYGTYDYELRVPALLRENVGASDVIDLFVEVS